MADLFEEIAADVDRAMSELAGEMEQVVRQKLSVPVEYKTGPRGGTVIIRSKPGENPRKETGALQQDMTGEVVTNGLLSELSLSSTKFYAPILQNKLARLVLSDTAEQFEDVIPDRITAAIRGQ